VAHDDGAVDYRRVAQIAPLLYLNTKQPLRASTTRHSARRPRSTGNAELLVLDNKGPSTNNSAPAVLGAVESSRVTPSPSPTSAAGR
jgi:hypothetical protein